MEKLKTTYRKFTALACMIFVCLGAVAQLPTEGDYRMRLGTKDPEHVLGWFNEFFGNDTLNWKAGKYNAHSYELFHRIISNAPYVDYYFYRTSFLEDKDSSQMFCQLLEQEKDPAIRMIYVQDVQSLANTLVAHLDSINVLRSLSKTNDGKVLAPWNEGIAKVWKAHVYYKYDKKYMPWRLYDQLSIYTLYTDAFKTFRKEKIGNDVEMEPDFLREYFQASLDLYNTDKDKYQEQFMQDYLDCCETCDKVLQPYLQETDSVKKDKLLHELAKYYNLRMLYMPNDFNATGAASPDRLQHFYGAKFQENKENKIFLERGIRFMYDNGATDINAYTRYCEAAYKLGPTFDNCLGMGINVGKDAAFAQGDEFDREHQEMLDYYKQAFDLAKTDIDKAKVAYIIATETWPKNSVKSTEAGYTQYEKNLNTSEHMYGVVWNARNALINTANTTCISWAAQARLHMAQALLRRSTTPDNISIRNCNTGIGMLNDVLRMDASLQNPVNSTYNNFKNRITALKQAIAKNNSNKQKASADAKAMAKYNAWKKKQEEEEAFWRGGK